MGKGRWIKLYSRILLDPDITKLSDKEFRYFINLLVVAGELQNGGKVPQKWLETVCKTTRIHMNSHLVIVRKLSDNGFISILSDGVKIRNWYKYQSTTAERLQREKRRIAALDKTRGDKKREETPTAGDANKYFYDTLENYANDMASVIQDFETTRRGGKIRPSVIIKIVDSWKTFGGNLLLEAKKEWDKGRYAKEGKRENYFLGICRRLAGESGFRRRKGLP